MSPLKQPTTKKAALGMLGITSPDELRRLAGLVDLAHFDTGAVLLTSCALRQPIHIGLAGSISVAGSSAAVDAPFVLDVWAPELATKYELDVVVEEPVAVLMVDRRARELLLTPIPHLRMRSRDTERRIRTAMALRCPASA